MDMSRRFQQTIDAKREKKRRKKRRRRLRRSLLFLAVVGFLLYKGTLGELYLYAANGGGEEILDRIKSAGTYLGEHLPDMRVWAADKLNYIAQFM